MKFLVFLVMLIPQLAAAKVFICTDPVSGKTTFTDVACDASATREEVRVPPTNVDSGSRTAAPAARKTWNSDRDSRKTGRDYNALARQLGADEQALTAVVDGRQPVEEGT